MTSWFRKRGSESHLNQTTTNNNDTNHVSERGQSHSVVIGDHDHPSEYHYLVTTFMQSESFHIFASSKLNDLRSSILGTLVDQSAFGPEIQNLNWDLHIANNNNTIKLSTNSQLYAFINKQHMHRKQTIRIRMQLVRDQKYKNWVHQRAQSAPKPPRLGTIKYGDSSCHIQVDCGWDLPILNAFQLEYQLPFLGSNPGNQSACLSPDNTAITIKPLWSTLAYKCRARLVHRIHNAASEWSEWTEDIRLPIAPLEMDEEKTENEYNLISYFECMDHAQLTQWTECKLFGNVSNPLCVYDDEKNGDVKNELHNKMWTTKTEVDSGLLSLVQYGIGQSELNGKAFLLQDPQQYIKQVVPTELVNNKNVENAGGYGMDDYLAILWRLREIAYLEGGNMKYSMNIPLYNPYTVYIWMFCLKIPSHEYALFCQESQSYVLLKHFSSERNNECHLFVGQYYVRQPPKDINIAFELHRIVQMGEFKTFNMNLASAKPVLLHGDGNVITIHTNNQQHVIARCYHQKDTITKYKPICDWQNLFVHRWKINGFNLPYFECMMDGIVERIVSKDIALCPAIDVLELMCFWHSQNDKNKTKVVNVVKQMLQATDWVWLKQDITHRNEIVQFVWYVWWVMDHIHTGDNQFAFNIPNKIVHQLLLGRFGSLDRVFPLLRTIFYGAADQYVQKIITLLQKNAYSLPIRMQLLLWLNFMHCIAPTPTCNKMDITIDKSNTSTVELTSDLMEMIRIDATLEQNTNTRRVYPLERDAFYVLRMNAVNNAQIMATQTQVDMDLEAGPSKHIHQLLSLLLIFEPNFHFLFEAHYADIIIILKQERNPIQCLEVMHSALHIDGGLNEKSFMSLVEPFIPKISNKSPLFLQKAMQNAITLKQNASESPQYEVIAMKHRLSMLNAENEQMKQRMNSLDGNTTQYMNTIQLLTKQSKETQNELEQQTVSNKAMIQTITVITDKQNTTEQQCVQMQNTIQSKDEEIKRLQQRIQSLQDKKHKRYRPLVLSPDAEKHVQVIEIDSDAFKVELLNYMKYQSQLNHKTAAKKYPPLLSFHEIKAQVILDWRSFKSQLYDDLIEILMDTALDDEEFDDKIPYNVAYKLILNCYLFMNEQRHTCNPMVSHMIYLNLSMLYGLKVKHKIPEMLHGVYVYLDAMITAICGNELKEKMAQSNDDELPCIVRKFMMRCCEILWSAIHYGYCVAPDTFDDRNHINHEFDDSIHKKENHGRGAIDCLVYPSLCKVKQYNAYQTKIWVCCADA